MNLGDPRLPPRFWAKIVVTDGGCWRWAAYRTKDGYGVVGTGSRTDGSRRSVRAHRVAYEALVGPVPAGLELDHLCRVRHCVNPEHLEAVDHATNSRRGDLGRHLVQHQRQKTHCPQGHAYDGPNTLLLRSAKGLHRVCRACRRERDRARRSRMAGAP